MNALSKIGLVAAGMHILFLLYVMYRMSGGGILLDPVGWILGAWAIALTAFVAWRSLHSKVWTLTLLPIILFGTYSAYIMGFVSTSSTTTLGLLFLPFYEWVFIGVVAIAKQVASE